MPPVSMNCFIVLSLASGVCVQSNLNNISSVALSTNPGNESGAYDTRLPKRLAQRNNKLQQQFKKAPYAEREAEANARREMFYDTVANTARSTRSKGLGNKNMYSVVPADEEEFKMKQANGWGKAVMMPKRLKERVAFLNAKFKNSLSEAFSIIIFPSMYASGNERSGFIISFQFKSFFKSFIVIGFSFLGSPQIYF